MIETVKAGRSHSDLKRSTETELRSIIFKMEREAAEMRRKLQAKDGVIEHLERVDRMRIVDAVREILPMGMRRL